MMATAVARNPKHTSVTFKGAVPKRQPPGVVLPVLSWAESPNFSDRHVGMKPFLVVFHRPVGRYGPSIEWLCSPDSAASAHWISEGNKTGVDVATQLVPWHLKAWACADFNSSSYNLEVDDDAWNGTDLGALLTACRAAAYLCKKTGIPAVSAEKDPLHKAGLVRHIALGKPGGGHTDPTEDEALWRWTVRRTQWELDRGGFRKTYGRGRLAKI